MALGTPILSNPFGNPIRQPGSGPAGMGIGTSTNPNAISQGFWGPDNRGLQPPTDPYAGSAVNPDALKFFQTLQGPDLALLAKQAGDLTGRYGQIAAGYGAQAGLLNQGNGIANQKLDVEQGAIDRQLGEIPGLQDILNQLFGIGQTADQQNHDMTKIQLGQALDKSNRGIISDNTARGSMATPGTEIAFNDVKNSFDNGMLSNEQQFKNSRDTAEQNRRKDQINLDEQKAGLDDRAKLLGLSRAELGNQLQQGLSKLGLDKLMNSNALQDALFSNDIQQRAVAENIYNQALDYSGYFDNLQSQKAIAGGGAAGAAAQRKVDDANNPLQAATRKQAINAFVTR